MSNTLLPCPFCGREALMETRYINVINGVATKQYVSDCHHCKATFARWFPSMKEADAAWNRRAGNDTEAMRKHIEALQQENERLADETIKLMKENAKNSNKKDELVKVLKQAKYLLRRYGDYIKSYPCNCKFALGFDGHKTPYRDGEMCERCTELAEIDKVIGGKEDV